MKKKKNGKNLVELESRTLQLNSEMHCTVYIPLISFTLYRVTEHTQIFHRCVNKFTYDDNFSGEVKNNNNNNKKSI